MTQIGNNSIQIFSERIRIDLEGKCIEEGYIKPRSTHILSYSSGTISGANVLINIIFECLVCHPVEGMLIDCVIKNITKAGIRCEIELSNELDRSPVIIFFSKRA